MSGPKPWPQHVARTTFVRVPKEDWVRVKRGTKTEFRTTGRYATQLWSVNCPTPVVAYAFTNKLGDHDSRLLVLEACWREPLGAISEDSLRAEGFESIAHFRRYWMQRTKRRFAPLTEVQVCRVRPLELGDLDQLGRVLLDRLYGEHLPPQAGARPVP